MSYAGAPAPDESTWSSDMEVAFDAMRVEVPSPERPRNDFPLAAHHLSGVRLRLEVLWPIEDD